MELKPDRRGQNGADFAKHLRTHGATGGPGSNDVQNSVHVTFRVSCLKFKLNGVAPAHVVKALFSTSTLALRRFHKISQLPNALPSP
jgi:hypothetical protein